MATVNGDLAGYFEARAQQRSDEAARLADSLTERELRLVREASVMGYVLGGMGGGHRGLIPPDRQILEDVLNGCLSHPDLYPVITGG